MDMKTALDHHIRINLQTNPVYETLSQRLDRLLRSKSKTELLAELQTLAKEIAEIEEKAKELGISKEEYAFLSVAKKYNSTVQDKDLIPFVKGLAKEVKSKTFTGWQKNRSVLKEVEQTIFDSCYQRFSGTLDTSSISGLTEELMKFVEKYNA